MAKCSELQRLIQAFDESTIAWHKSRVPSLLAGAKFGTMHAPNLEALEHRNASANALYLHMKTCAKCKRDKTVLRSTTQRIRPSIT